MSKNLTLDIEKFFNEEVREQKHKAFLNKARTGRKGSSKSRKGMFTPYDAMSRVEKRKLNGEVTIFKMYETILTKQEFDAKDESLQVMMLTRWREIFDNHTIRTQMGLSNKDYYELVNQLNLPKKSRKEVMEEARKRKAKIKAEKVSSKAEKEDLTISEAISEVISEVLSEAPKVEALPPAPAPEVKPILISRGLHLEYNGDYTSEEIGKIFKKLQVLTEDEKNMFSLSISITERT